MMKKITLGITAIFISYQSFSQDFLGLGTGNYGGVSGLTLNPASVVDNRLKLDINIIGISSFYTNNYLSVKRNALVNGDFFKSRYKDWNLVQRDLLEENQLGANERVNARLNTRVMAPLSFMVTTGEKSAIALTIENRTNVMLNNVNRDLARLAYQGFNDPSLFNTPLNLSGISADVLNWVDVGLTYGRVLVSQNNHFLKAAVTGKYIGGVASGYFESDDFEMGFNSKSQFIARTGHMQYGHSNRLNTDMFRSATLRSLRPEAEGFGWSAGLVYEYRGNIEKFKYITPENKEKNRRDVNKYAFRLGVSIMDAGKLRFNKGGFNNDFTADITNWNMNNYTIKTIQDIDNMLAEQVDHVTTADGSYTVALPTAFSTQLDLHLGRGFYVNAMTYQPVQMVKADRQMNIEAMYAVTPRFESKAFGFYVPVTYNDFDKWNLGATLRLGPVYVGSANLASLVFNNKVRSADVHAGLRIPIAHGSPSKISKLYDRLTSKPKEDTLMLAAIQNIQQKADSITTAKQAELDSLKQRLYEMEKQRIVDSMRLLLQVPTAQSAVTTPAPVNITINNFPAGATPSNVSVDSVVTIAGRTLPVVSVDSTPKVDASPKVQQGAVTQEAVAPKDNQGNISTKDSSTIKPEVLIIEEAETKKDTVVVQQDTATMLSESLRKNTKDEKTVLGNEQGSDSSHILSAANNLQAQRATDSAIRAQQDAYNQYITEQQQKVSEERLSMQRNMQQQQQKIKDMEAEIIYLRNRPQMNTVPASRVQRAAPANLSSNGDAASTISENKEKSGFRPFAVLRKKNNEEQPVNGQVEMDNMVEEDTLVSEEKKKWTPFGFLKKKDGEPGDGEQLAEEKELHPSVTDDEPKKKFRPFAFFLKKQKDEEVVLEEKVTTTTEKKKWKPFGFLSKKEEAAEVGVVVEEEAKTVREKKKFRPFSFLSKKTDDEKTIVREVEEENPKKKWKPFGFLKKKDK